MTVMEIVLVTLIMMVFVMSLTAVLLVIIMMIVFLGINTSQTTFIQEPAGSFSTINKR